MSTTNWLNAAVNLNSGAYSYKPRYEQQNKKPVKYDEDEIQPEDDEATRDLKQELENTVSFDNKGQLVSPTLSRANSNFASPIARRGDTSDHFRTLSTPVLPPANYFDDAPSTSTLSVMPDGRLA